MTDRQTHPIRPFRSKSKLAYVHAVEPRKSRSSVLYLQIRSNIKVLAHITYQCQRQLPITPFTFISQLNHLNITNCLIYFNTHAFFYRLCRDPKVFYTILFCKDKYKESKRTMSQHQQKIFKHIFMILSLFIYYLSLQYTAFYLLLGSRYEV